MRVQGYAEISARVMEIIERFFPIVEQVSVDEAFLDVRGGMRLWKTPLHLAQALKESIWTELDLRASVGIAPNKFLAKLDSDLDKPDGLSVVPTAAREIAAFLAPLSISRIWGIGKVTAEKLQRYGVTVIGELQQMKTERLKPIVGEAAARHIGRLAFGLDDRPVSIDRARGKEYFHRTYL